MTPHETTDKIKQLPDGDQLLYIFGGYAFGSVRLTINDLKNLVTKLEQAEAALRDAREAIEKYADEDEWLCDTCDNPYGQCNASLHRLGNWQGSPNGPTIARKWLERREK